MLNLLACSSTNSSAFFIQSLNLGFGATLKISEKKKKRETLTVSSALRCDINTTPGPNRNQNFPSSEFRRYYWPWYSNS
jgi:hypothetical protein